MTMRWRWAILGGGFGLYLIGLGFLGGIVAERVRFDHQRLVVLNRYDEALKKWQAHLMSLEKAASGAQGATWQVNEALTRKDIPAAQRAWREAYVAALKNQRWEGLVEAGDLYLRIGDAAGDRKAALPQARQAYLRAMVRARADGAVDGVLRVAEAFDKLGDREVAERSLRIAERMAAQTHDAESSGRVSAFRERLAGPRVDVRPVSLRSSEALAAP